MNLDRRIAAELARVKEAGLQRTLRTPVGIDLCSNDYLGLAAHPHVKRAMATAALREGAGSTGSRLLRGERSSFRKLETAFARFKRTERSLYFSSGYLANLAVLSTFPQEGDVIFSDALNHASLIDGIKLSKARCVVFPHGDVEALEGLLRRATGQAFVQAFVVVESVYSMDGDFAPLAQYAALCKKYGATLIVDEAHAVGIYGQRGSGLIEQDKLDKDVFVSINSAGKALGVAGAFVAGPGNAIELLVQKARPFIFSTAPVPASAAALQAALGIVSARPALRKRLVDNARYLREQLQLPSGSHIIPVILGDNDKAMGIARKLQQRGFDVRAVRPPTVPAGTARLRISVNAALSRKTLKHFSQLLLAEL